MKEKILKGKKVYLQAPRMDNAPEFIKSSKTSRKFHAGWASPPKDEDNFQVYFKRSEQPENEYFLILRISDGAIAGAINLSQIFRAGFQNAYLGYYLFEKFTGKGLMDEAVRLILKHSFQNLRLHRIEANVQPENIASIRVLERAGFTKEGFSRKYLKIGGKWRDHERWAIIVDDWKINNGYNGS
jgi:ribosomal-protein-alanine N-acetyltransferase